MNDDKTSSTSFDMASYDPRACANAGAELAIVDPLGRETDLRIFIQGADSDAYTDEFRRIQRRQSKEFERTRKIRAQTPEQVEEDVISLLTAVTTGWNDAVKAIAGEFNPLNARTLYRTRKDIREQVDAGISERGNFLQSSVKS